MKSAADLLCEVPLLSSDDRATRARSVLRDDHFREALVVDGRGALAGYIDISDILRVGATRSNVTVDGFVREAPSVGPDASLERVGRCCASTGPTRSRSPGRTGACSAGSCSPRSFRSCSPATSPGAWSRS